jgi:hemerythrin-like domain-containing protein
LSIGICPTSGHEPLGTAVEVCSTVFSGKGVALTCRPMKGRTGIMATPLDAVTAIHNAFRRDIADIDAAALGAARGEQNTAATIERFRFFNEVLVWHAHGEELAVFPVLEGVAPSVAEAYLKDHRGLDAAFDALDRAYSARDPLETARATAAFKFHLDIHLAKEDTHLYRLFRERVSVPEQGKAVGIMSRGVPQDRFPEVVGWMFPLLGDDDRENMTRILKQVNPPEAFAGAGR